MGLDMYLSRCKKIPNKTFSEILEIEDKISDKDKDTLEKYVDYIQDCGETFTWKSLFKECGYWRKANAIHRWFVDNIQGEEDNCENYEVKKENIVALRDICKEVLDNSELVKGKVQNGTRYENGKEIPIMEDGKYIKNSTKAEELLPTQKGFFFGGTDYNEWYYEDIKYTHDLCSSVLKLFDFDNNYLVYTSSW